MQADEFDQVHDLRLGAPQQEHPLTPAQPVRKRGQIDHQRGVGEVQVAQIHDHVRLSPEREHQGPATEALRAPILISGA